MVKALKQRGPDGGGVYSQKHVAMGHRRLSILDLSANGAQPMIDPELGLAVVFNGCIYNFRELREQLAGKGYRFFSNCDTEVILKAYHAWGPRCVERFKGMFAFAMLEHDSGRVVLARDRLGIKPLYYTADGIFRFASTLPALLATGEVNTAFDPRGLHHYFSFHGAIPAPLTLFKGVRKLAPGKLLTLEPNGARREESWWQLSVAPDAADAKISVQEWTEALRDELGSAVERRRVADVPQGVLLSGGLDSSLIVALLAERGAQNLETFSLGFDEHGGEEFAYSDFIARRFGTKHHRILATTAQMLEAMPGAVASMSEPQVSHDTIGFYLLSKKVTQHVKVVHCGQGADEVFGGYHWHSRMAGSNDPASDFMRLYGEHSHAEIGEALSPEFVSSDFSSELIARKFDDAASDRAIDKTLELEQTVMLADDPVKRVDNMTMAFGVEARVPLLDHAVVELAARIPAALKIGNGGKQILKDASRGLVPDEVIDRKKGYFPNPAIKTIQGPVLDFVRDVFAAPAARARGLFREGYIERLFRNPRFELTGKGNSKLWQACMLEYWLQVQRV
jgi:asparagine synthase (glutamine-hydrolysing)